MACSILQTASRPRRLPPFWPFHDRRPQNCHRSTGLRRSQAGPLYSDRVPPSERRSDIQCEATWRGNVIENNEVPSSRPAGAGAVFGSRSVLVRSRRSGTQAEGAAEPRAGVPYSRRQRRRHQRGVEQSEDDSAATARAPVLQVGDRTFDQVLQRGAVDRRASDDAGYPEAQARSHGRQARPPSECGRPPPPRRERAAHGALCRHRTHAVARCPKCLRPASSISR